MSVFFNILFENNCLKYPNHLAISYKNKSYSYVELDEYTNQFGHYLTKQGIRKGSLVAIFSQCYLERIAAILSLWKLGAAYLPIDPNYPSERISFILNDSKVNFIITDSKNYDHIPLGNMYTSILLDDKDNKVGNSSKSRLFNEFSASDLAYVAYTSGSTGKPKGAMITQGNIASIYSAWEKVYGLTCFDRHLQISNFGFDVCSGDIIRALGSGAQLILSPDEYLLDPKRIYELLAKKSITVSEFTPAILRRLIDYLDEKGFNLYFMRLLICGSDNWYLKEYKKFRSFLSANARLINSYGTTETTIDSSYFETNKAISKFDEQLSVPIGSPFPKTVIKILDKKLKDCPTGTKGEIYIGGSGVCLGYLNQPELTQQKFITLLLKEGRKEVFYKTGDLGYYLPNGNIVLSGRKDYQIKIMDRRVSISEVEDVLNSHSTIQKAVVIAHSFFDSKEKYLIAFLKTSSNEKFEINKYLNFLKEKLPMYSIPVFYLLVPSFPISYHGKLDRLKLICKNKVNNKLSVNNNPNEKLFMLKILQDIFNISCLNNYKFFFNTDTNPVLQNNFIIIIKNYYYINIELKDLIGVHTVEQLAHLLNL